MLIRCEKCNTLYELDEKLLPATGAPVQCSKCQFVFKAYPGPREDLAPANAAISAKDEAAPPEEAKPVGGVEEGLEPANGAREPVGAEPTDASSPSAASRRETTPPAEPKASARSAPTAGSPPGTDEPQFTADGRPIRKVPFPTEEPASVGVRPSLGRIPARPSGSSSQRRWALVVVPVVLALVLAAAFVAWRVLARRSDPASAQPRAEGHSLLLPGEGAPARSDPVRRPASPRPHGGGPRA